MWYLLSEEWEARRLPPISRGTQASLGVSQSHVRPWRSAPKPNKTPPTYARLKPHLKESGPTPPRSPVPRGAGLPPAGSQPPCLPGAGCLRQEPGAVGAVTGATRTGFQEGKFCDRFPRRPPSAAAPRGRGAAGEARSGAPPARSGAPTPPPGPAPRGRPRGDERPRAARPGPAAASPRHRPGSGAEGQGGEERR